MGKPTITIYSCKVSIVRTDTWLRRNRTFCAAESASICVYLRFSSEWVRLRLWFWQGPKEQFRLGLSTQTMRCRLLPSFRAGGSVSNAKTRSRKDARKGNLRNSSGGRGFSLRLCDLAPLRLKKAAVTAIDVAPGMLHAPRYRRADEWHARLWIILGILFNKSFQEILHVNAIFINAVEMQSITCRVTS
jgi:hypothetical protein